MFDLTSSMLAAPQGLQVEVLTMTWTPELPHGGSAGPQPMGRHDVGERHDNGFRVYPDGRDGVECAVAFEVTAAMQDENHDAIAQVEVYDDEVWIYGMAIPGHTDWEDAFACAR